MVKNNIISKKVSQCFLSKDSITVKNKYKKLNSKILKRKRKKKSKVTLIALFKQYVLTISRELKTNILTKFVY
jgi:hypothetical protein